MLELLDRDPTGDAVNAELIGDSGALVVGRSHLTALELARLGHARMSITCDAMLGTANGPASAHEVFADWCYSRAPKRCSARRRSSSAPTESRAVIKPAEAARRQLRGSGAANSWPTIRAEVLVRRDVDLAPLRTTVTSHAGGGTSRCRARGASPPFAHSFKTRPKNPAGIFLNAGAHGRRRVSLARVRVVKWGYRFAWRLSG